MNNALERDATAEVEARSHGTELRTPENRTPGPAPWKQIVVVLLLALVARVVCLERAPLVGADSPRFLAAAEAFETMDVVTAVSDPYHPLPAYLVSRANLLQRKIVGAPEGIAESLRHRERAGAWVMILTGLLAVWLLMDLSRRLFPMIPPVAVGLLAAVQPYFVRTSADILSDMPHLAFFLLALRQAAVDAEQRRPGAGLAAGGATGLAYLCRPEALVLVLAIPAFWLVAARHPLRALIGRTVVFGVGAATLVLPYAVTISILTGVPTITLKKDLYRFLLPERDTTATQRHISSDVSTVEASATPVAGVRPAHSPADENAAAVPAVVTPVTDGAPEPAVTKPETPSRLAPFGRAALRIGERWFSTAPSVLGGAFLIGLLVLLRLHGLRLHGLRRGLTLFGIPAAGLGGVLLLLIGAMDDPGYLSRRHVLPLVALSLPVAALGVLAVGWWLGRSLARLGSPRLRRSTASSTAASTGKVVFLAAVLCVLSLKATAPQRLDQQAQRDVGHWILEGHGPGSVVFTDREKVAYYAGADWRLFTEDPRTTLEFVQMEPRAFVAFYDDKVSCPDLAAVLDDPASGLRRVRTVPEDRGKKKPRALLVYLWERP